MIREFLYRIHCVLPDVRNLSGIRPIRVEVGRIWVLGSATNPDKNRPVKVVVQDKYLNIDVLGSDIRGWIT